MSHTRSNIKTIIALLIINLAILSSSVKAQWQQPDTTVFTNTLASIGNITLGAKNGVMYSTNSGASWTLTNQGLPPAFLDANYAQFLWVKGSKVFLGININGTQQTDGLFMSLDSGKSWSPRVDGMLLGTSTYTLAQKDSYLIAGTDDGVYLSTNDGELWYKPSADLNKKVISCLAVNSSNMIFAGILGESVKSGLGVFATTNYGANWIEVNNGLPPQTTIFSMVFLNNILFGTSTDGRVFKSVNNAGLWTPSDSGISFFYNEVHAINKFGNNLLIGCDDGIFLSTNQGDYWILQNIGLRFGTQIEKNALIQSGDYVFVAANNGVYRKPVGQVSVQNISNVVSDKYKLEQNYPNPFNPVTKIRFEIPKSSFVNLVIYNASGREVATLVNQKLNSGIYEKTFDASSLTSGVYFYRITSESFMETKKMLLIK